MLWMSVDRESKVTMTRQVFQQIRKKILDGELGAGMRLPSTRELAAELKVSRNIMVEVYEMLLAEGYATGLQGSGTYVAEGASIIRASSELAGGSNISRSRKKEKVVVDFRSGLPALDLFPITKWGSIYRELCGSVDIASLGYGSPAGCPELRSALTLYLHNTRGVSCKAENMIITTGAVQALQLLTNLLLSRGDRVLLEDPSNHDLQRIFSYSGAVIQPVPVDSRGIRTDLLNASENARLVYVTPSHQFPLGGLLPIQRRIELVNFARATSCYIVEDDYDSEYRYEGPAVSSLQSLDPDRVIYVGTFSKILYPSLRIGYLVLPESLVTACTRLKRHSDYQTPLLEQRTLARFIEDGLLSRHIRKMKNVYRGRQDILVECLKKAFGSHCSISGNSTGLHLIAEFDFKITGEMLYRLKYAGVRVYPVELHSIARGDHANKLIMGYGHLTEEQIREGVGKLAVIL